MIVPILALALLLQGALPGIEVPPPPRGFGTSTADVVVDRANVLDPMTIEKMNAIAFDVHAKSGGEITVVTLPDIGDSDVSDVALSIGRAWGVGAKAAIGSAQRNAGAVILLVPKESSSDGKGHCFVATGMGAEGFIRDADAGDICREATPMFRERDYASGLDLVTVRVAERFASEFNFALDTSIRAPEMPAPMEPATRRRGGGINPLVLLIIFFVVMSLLNSGRRRRSGCGGCIPIFLPMGGGGGGWSSGRGGGWGGGGFGGGGGGFGGFGGGGGFSGGGGGSSW